MVAAGKACFTAIIAGDVHQDSCDHVSGSIYDMAVCDPKTAHLDGKAGLGQLLPSVAGGAN